jgi:prophage regulatory protein
MRSLLIVPAMSHHPSEKETNDQLLNVRVVCERLTLSRTTIWRYVTIGEFPKPIKIGLRRKAWRESEVSEWLKTRSAA